MASPATAVPSGAGGTGAHRAATSWVGTWADVPTAVPAGGVTTLEDQTVRQVVHTSTSGRRLRIRLTNEFGTEPLRIGEVHVARRAPGSAHDIVPRTDRRVAFDGHRSATVPAGAPLVSDPVRLRVPARSDLVISIHLPRPTPVTTLHAFAYQENVLADVNANQPAPPRPEPAGRQPGRGLRGLLRRERAAPLRPGRRGPAGCPLPGHAARGQRPRAPRHPGTSAPESETVSARQVIAGHRQLVARAHSLGMQAYGGTILPFKGDTLGFHSPVNERKRQKVNRWIRTSGVYDAVIDFARAVKDPEHPKRLLPRYDSGDHLHPNDAGMWALARAVPLDLFR